MYLFHIFFLYILFINVWCIFIVACICCEIAIFLLFHFMYFIFMCKFSKTVKFIDCFSFVEIKWYFPFCFNYGDVIMNHLLWHVRASHFFLRCLCAEWIIYIARILPNVFNAVIEYLHHYSSIHCLFLQCIFDFIGYFIFSINECYISSLLRTIRIIFTPSSCKYETFTLLLGTALFFAMYCYLVTKCFIFTYFIEWFFCVVFQ